MHILFQKIFARSSSPLEKWRAHIANVDARMSPWTTAFLSAANNSETIGKTASAFLTDPSAENLASWKKALAERASAHDIAQTLNAWIDSKRLTILGEGRGLLLDVISEAEEELKTRIRKVRESDERQSAEFGEAFVSEEPLKKLSYKMSCLSKARSVIARDVVTAANHVGEAIEESI